MSPLNVTLTDLIDAIDADLPGDAVLAKVTEAQSRAHTLAALGDELVGHYVAIAKEQGASWSEIGDAIGVSKQAAQQRHAPQIFSRFTNLARHAVVLSQEAARSHRHDFIGTEHVLLGLLDEPRGLAARLLTSRAGSADAVRDAVDAVLVPSGKKTPRGHIPFTPHSKQALDAAIAAAAGLGHDFIGTEHVLLGLLAVTDSKATEALGSLNIDLAAMRPLVQTATAELLAQQKTTTDE